MNKSELIEKCVELGIDANGTVVQLKDRIEAYNGSAKPVKEERLERNFARHDYRKSAHMPK